MLLAATVLGWTGWRRRLFTEGDNQDHISLIIHVLYCF